MMAIYVVLLALVHIGLLLVMSLAAVSILNDDVQFTEDGSFSIDAGTVKRVMVKGGIFMAGFVVYVFMLWNFKFID